ncbi:MAG: Na+/H+ antiporter NhaA [Polyangiaceae bacterium]|nr:Na+/H+ antiporter NhaA [Polyangiaceae bacterium]
MDGHDLMHFWINDGLMVIFFFVVGREIRRGSTRRAGRREARGAAPIAAAIGGMIVPALIYAAFNRGLPTQGGWGVPMATDIAFAVGVLALLRQAGAGGAARAPPGARHHRRHQAILVIAIFSSGVSPMGFRRRRRRDRAGALLPEDRRPARPALRRAAS